MSRSDRGHGPDPSDRFGWVRPVLQCGTLVLRVLQELRRWFV